MACNRIRVRNLGNKKYPSVRTISKYQFISNKNIEIENIIVELLDSDTKIVTFDKTFSGTPSVVANFISPTPLPNINVFIESSTPTQVVIKTSSPVTGQIHIQAMFIES